MEGRVPSAAWPIICSNGGPSVQLHKQKPCIGFCCSPFPVIGRRCPTLPESIKSSIRQAAVRRLRASDAGPPPLAVTGVCSCEECRVFFYLLSLLSFFSSLFVAPSQVSKSNFYLTASSHSACTNCRVSGPMCNYNHCYLTIIRESQRLKTKHLASILVTFK